MACNLVIVEFPSTDGASTRYLRPETEPEVWGYCGVLRAGPAPESGGWIGVHGRKKSSNKNIGDILH